MFAITTSGEEKVFYSFRGGHGSGGACDDSNPYSSLLNVKGKLYGMTYYGGRFRYGFCCGTVFWIAP